MMRDTRVMGFPDGRELAWLELGDATDPAVFVFHGSPGSRLQVSFDEGAVKAARAESIAVDRPGYGHSSFQRDRRLADWASDISRLADHLHLDRFSVVGISEAGPTLRHAPGSSPIGCGRRGSSAAWVLWSHPGSEDEMMAFNRVITRLDEGLRYLPYPLFLLNASLFRRWPERSMRVTSGHLPPADIDIMRRPDVRAAYIDSIDTPCDQRSRCGARLLPLATPWGFRLEDIVVPVHVWHGDEDRNVPLAHGRLQAERIPGARLHECPGEGHLLALWTASKRSCARLARKVRDHSADQGPTVTKSD